MSIIIKQWKCEECGAEFDRYISFGHPDEDFDYKWKCDECGHINTYPVKVFPQQIRRKIKHTCRNCIYSIFDPLEISPAKYRCYHPFLYGRYTSHSPKDSCNLWKQKDIYIS